MGTLYRWAKELNVRSPMSITLDSSSLVERGAVAPITKTVDIPRASGAARCVIR